MSDGTTTPFGKYELLERLGAGGMAIVYRARYTAAPGITKPVVIKRVLGHYAEDQAFVEMFVQEARISVGLNHGNIVQVFDFGQVDGEYFLAMELVDGQPLSRLLKQAEAMGLAQLPPPLAVSIAIEMCKGLHHAHTRKDERGRPLGLVHRDISPDNVLISYEGEVKISDFGIAKAQLAGRPVTESGVVKGKYRYLSPEQAYAVPDLDARSDVYAVGVVLYRMLCGRLPADGHELSVMQRIANGQLTPPRELAPELDAELVQILQNALATDREARTPSAEALHLQLSQWFAVMAPLFPVHTLKHLMGLVFESELREKGRTPQLPPRFEEQVAMWSRSQQRQLPRTDSVPAAQWPGTPAPTSGRTGPRESPEVDSQTTRPARRVSRPDHRVTQTVPEMPSVELAEATQEMAPVEKPVSRPRAAARAREPKAREPEATGDAYAGVTRFLMGLIPHWRVVVGVAVVAVMAVKIVTWVFFGTPPLMIVSEPPGALVSLDREFKGVTPLKLENVSRAEPHTVELSRVGMKAWSRRFEPGTLEDQLRVSLEPVSGTPPKPSAPAQAPPSMGDASASRSGAEKTPTRFTVREKEHSFDVVARSFREVLDPKRAYTVWLTGSYKGDAPISEEEVRQGLSADEVRSTQVYVYLEGERVPTEERLFMLSSNLHTLTSAEALHAFLLVGAGSEHTVDQDLTLHIRDNVSKKVAHHRLDPRRFANTVGLESRYSVRQLDPRVSYALDIRTHEGAAATPVAVLAVPHPGEPVEVSGQPSTDFRYALPPGRYTVKGARELWFSLPRSQRGGAEVEMDVALSVGPASSER
ncbi:serine/threonine-protein kinase [Hyalangium gracile]|uniref:serine/threonine-protein kinase n=1 Tax=Hyalangium gracile TaxID=394092 RepID=UPI001CCFF6A5|nr:serine/threonine-protein kinase [Hyalangium gracile]